MVARFDTPHAAERLLGELRAGYVPGAPYSEAWTRLFRAEEIDTPGLDAGRAPDELCVLGASLLARTLRASGDAFPELRALAWKRGARVLDDASGRGGASLLFAVQALSPADAANVVGHAPAGETMLAIHGDVAVGVAPLGDEGLEAVAMTVRELAGARPLAAQLYAGEVDLVDFLERVQGLDAPLEAESRLVLRAADDEAAAALAVQLGERAVAAGDHVVAEVEGGALRHMAVVALRAGARVTPLLGRTVAIHVPGHPELGQRTADPVGALASLAAFARSLSWAMRPELTEVDPLDAAIRARVSEARARRPRPVQGRPGPHS